jgi:hypothetical protein
MEIESRELLSLLQSIDVSLQILAQNKTKAAKTVFVSKKVIASRLGVPPVTIDKLIYQGITSGGKSGLVELRHYCKLDPTEQNTSNFLFDPVQITTDAWASFTNYDNV